MGNGFGSLYIGQSGLQSAQNALNTTANNLSNVSTTGYVRQQVRFADKTYNKLKDPTKNVNLQQYGLGVSIGDVAHARDIFLDKSFRQESDGKDFIHLFMKSRITRQICFRSYMENSLRKVSVIFIRHFRNLPTRWIIPHSRIWFSRKQSFC